MHKACSNTWFVVSCCTSAFCHMVLFYFFACIMFFPLLSSCWWCERISVHTVSYVIVLLIKQWVYRRHHLWQQFRSSQTVLFVMETMGTCCSTQLHNLGKPSRTQWSLDWCSYSAAVSFFVLNTRSKACYSELRLQTHGCRVGKYGKLFAILFILWKMSLVFSDEDILSHQNVDRMLKRQTDFCSGSGLPKPLHVKETLDHRPPILEDFVLRNPLSAIFIFMCKICP